MTKDDGVNTWKVASIVLLVLLIACGGLLAYNYNHPVVEKVDTIECPETIEDKAILDVAVYDWGENEYNSNEMLFNYWVTNYGDVEARDIRVICKLDDDYSTAFSATDYYGNLASRSSEFGEFTSKTTSNVDSYTFYSAYCYIESCSNCEILHKRIPELVESYE